jgi:hypothetical protein
MENVILNLFLPVVGTARWAVSETQRSAGVSELRGPGDGPAPGPVESREAT